MLLGKTSFCYSGASRMITTWHHKLIIINSSTYSNNDDDVYNTYSECCTSYKIDLTCGRFDNRSNCTMGAVLPQDRPSTPWIFRRKLRRRMDVACSST